MKHSLEDAMMRKLVCSGPHLTLRSCFVIVYTYTLAYSSFVCNIPTTNPSLHKVNISVDLHFQADIFLASLYEYLLFVNCCVGMVSCYLVE